MRNTYIRVSRHNTLLRVKSEKGEPGILVPDAHPDTWRETLIHLLEKEAGGLVNGSPTGISAPTSLSGRFLRFSPHGLLEDIFLCDDTA